MYYQMIEIRTSFHGCFLIWHISDFCCIFSAAAPSNHTSPVMKKKVKGKDKEDKKTKKKIKIEPVDPSSIDERVASPAIQPQTAAALEVPPDILTREDDVVPDFPLPE